VEKEDDDREEEEEEEDQEEDPLSPRNPSSEADIARPPASTFDGISRILSEAVGLSYLSVRIPKVYVGNEGGKKPTSQQTGESSAYRMEMPGSHVLFFNTRRISR